MCLPFKEFFRNKRNKPFIFIINAISLFLAFVAIVVIFTHTYRELRHDRQVEHRHEIVRLELTHNWGSTPGAYAPWLAQVLPDVEQFCRVFSTKLDIVIPGQEGIEKRVAGNYEVFMVDTSFSSMFSLRFLKGTLPQGTDWVMLSESIAGQLFPGTNPIGKRFVIDNRMNVSVCAVFKDIHTPGIYRPNVIVSLANQGMWTSQCEKEWKGNNFDSYLLLKKGCDRKEVEIKFRELYAKQLQNFGVQSDKLEDELKQVVLRNYTDIYFNTPLFESCGHGNWSNLKMLMSIALLVLVVSIINYVNIATAKITDQIRNISLKRTFGARRFPLFFSIVLDSIMTCLFVMIIAFLVANQLSGLWERWLDFKVMAYVDFFYFVMLLLVIPLVCGVLSGIFPAFFLTCDKILMLGKNALTGLQRFKSGLMILQFVISFGLIISTLFIFKQMNYVKKINPGYNRENIAMVYGGELGGNGIGSKYPEFRELLLRNPLIQQVGISRDPIYNIEWSDGTFGIEGIGKMLGTNVDTHLMDMLGLDIIEGDWNENDLSAEGEIWINERMANIISTLLPHQNYPEEEWGRVLKDFNFQSLSEPIKPIYLKVFNSNQWPKWGRCCVYIKLMPEDKEKALAYIKECFTRLYPDTYYQYNFMDDNYKQLYGAEDLFFDRLLVLTLLSIGVACMGLLAFIAFFIEQNTKNIGVRKVMGATEIQIMGLLHRDILLRIFIGYLLSSPFTYFIMTRWVSDFAYKTAFSWWIFVVALGLMICIAFASVSLLIWKAARTNTVEYLKE